MTARLDQLKARSTGSGKSTILAALRESSRHSPSFEQAIMDSMREDPDVMRLTLNAAETGHRMLATLHSSTSAEAISRLSLLKNASGFRP
jgi:Tfp pilus assembly pilus retraction ATPase PilT